MEFFGESSRVKRANGVGLFLSSFACRHLFLALRACEPERINRGIKWMAGHYVSPATRTQYNLLFVLVRSFVFSFVLLVLPASSCFVTAVRIGVWGALFARKIVHHLCSEKMPDFLVVFHFFFA